MKYLVFGAGGFLGSTLVKHLQRAGKEVYGVQRRADGGAFAVDITIPEQFSRISVQPDVVINCASALPDAGRDIGDPAYLRQLFDANVLGGANIMNWAAASTTRKVINCSTLVVIGKPWPVPLREDENTYPTGSHVGYSASKLSQELVMTSIAAAHGMELLHVRISALYGPGMKGGGILNKLIRQAEAKETINLTNGNKVTVDFLHVEDAARVIYHLSKMDAWFHPVLNLASGEEVSLVELAEILCRITGNPTENIINVDGADFSSRSKVDTTLLEKYLQGTEISTRPFAEKVKTMFQ